MALLQPNTEVFVRISKSVASLGAVSLLLVALLAWPISSVAANGRHTATDMVTVNGLVTASGHAEPGVMVELHAWPDQTVLSNLKPGQTVPWVLVGRAKSTASGQYTVTVPVARLMPEATDGVVNLEADSKTAMYAFPLVVKKSAGNAFILGLDQVVNLASTHKRQFTCLGDWHYDGSAGKHWATVGQTYVPTTHAQQKFVYTKGQFSSIGFGVSVSNTYGSFSEDGTWAQDATFKEPFKKYGARHSYWYQTMFHWGHYHCVSFGVTTGYGTHVNGYVGGARTRKPTFVPGTPKNFCVFQQAGTDPQSNNSVAVTWTDKLGVHAYLGFDASTVTGYDDSAQVTYYMGADRYLCGQKDVPGGHPRQLVVRQRK